MYVKMQSILLWRGTESVPLLQTLIFALSMNMITRAACVWCSFLPGHCYEQGVVQAG